MISGETASITLGVEKLSLIGILPNLLNPQDMTIQSCNQEADFCFRLRINVAIIKPLPKRV